MSVLEVDRLIDACSDEGLDCGVTIRSELAPLAGPGAPVKPAVYAGGRYQVDRRWWGEEDERRPVDVVVIDNVPSQANRLESALRRRREVLGLPEIILDLSSVGALPPHLPRQLSSFQFPHRHADAYLRDALLGGEPFWKTDIGARIAAATVDDALALIEWFPQSLLYGFWQSHLGTKRSQAKLARSWVSEIVGFVPATIDTRTLATKGDPLNLSTEDRAVFPRGNEDRLSWHMADEKKSGAKGERLSESGHGQVVVSGEDASPAGISFETVVQQSTVSFAALRQISTGGAQDIDASMRALLVALGLVAHVEAFGRSCSLRSGCELRHSESTWTWLGAAEDDPIDPLDRATAEELFRSCVTKAVIAGLPVGEHWAKDALVLTPNDALRDAIAKTWPLGEEAEA